MVCSGFRQSSGVCRGKLIFRVLFMCALHSVQMFSPFCSDVQSVMFLCSLRSVQMFSPLCSYVHSVLFRCSVRSVQMFSPFCSDVQSVLLRFPACRPTAADSVQLLSTGRRFTTSPLWPLPVGSLTQDDVAAMFSPQMTSRSSPPTALCDLCSSQPCSSPCECQQ